MLIAAALPGPAVAQVPDLPPLPGLPPVGQPNPPNPPRPPSQEPPAAGARGSFGDVVSYRMNPQHTGFTKDDSAFGPLYRLWSRRFQGPVSQPLVVPGLVIANVANLDEGYGSRVIAFDLRSGRRVWTRRTPGTYYSAHIAIDRGRVVALNTDGVLRAFAVANGRPLWTYRPPGDHFAHESIPVAAGGTAYFVAEHPYDSTTYLYAVEMRTGRLRWRRVVPTDFDRAMPALDGRRAIVSDACGNAVALRRSDGAVAWSRASGSDCYFGAPGLLLGSLFFTAGRPGFVYDAATGATRGRLPGGAPDAAAGRLGYVPWRNGPVRARSLRTGATRWKRKGDMGGFGESLRPIVSRETVFVGTSNGKLLGLDRTAGTVYSISDLPYESYSAVGGPQPGIAAGHGVVVATGGARLTAFAPVLRPQPRGTDVAASAFDVKWGKTVYFAGGLGSRLRHERPVRRVLLQADAYPFKGFRTADRFHTLRNGTVFFYGRLDVNTRVRVDLAARRDRARWITIYVYPHKHARWRPAGPGRGQVTVTMRAGKQLRLGGHGLVIYWRPHGSRDLTRIDSDRMHQIGRGRARGKVVFSIPSGTRRSDRFYWCVTKVRGYGRPHPLTRHCGRSHVRL